MTLRPLLLIALLYTAGDFAYRQIPDALLADTIYPQVVNAPAARMINFVDRGAEVRVAGNMLTSARASLEVVRGCDGVGLLLLVLAAVLAAPLPPRRRLHGALLCGVVVYLINELRIVSLYFVQARAPGWFETAHLYALPLLTIAVVVAVHARWLDSVHEERR